MRAHYRRLEVEESLANELLLPNFYDERLFTPFHTVFLYVIPLVLAGVEYYLETSENHKFTTLGIAVMLMNILVLALSLYMSSNMVGMLNTARHISGAYKAVRVVVVTILLTYGYVEFGVSLYVLAIETTVGFSVLLSLVLIMLVVGGVMLKYKGVNRNWRGVYIVLNMSTPYTAVEHTDRLLAKLLAGLTYACRHVVCPIALGWFAYSSEKRSVNSTTLHVAFSMGVLSTINASFGMLCFQWLKSNAS